MLSSYARLPLLTAVCLAVAGPAMAHTGAGPAHGFVHGLEHPVFGLDHLLAMVAVGLWAGFVGGRAMWVWPATFVGVMVAGAFLGMAGVGIPFVEPGIVASVVVLGAVTALAFKAPLAAGTALVAIFALFHGHAHGTEAPADASGLSYILGFAIATAFLHLVGLAVGRLVSGPAAGLWLVRGAGAAVAVAGVVLAVG